jgi:hypothetical protein
VFDEKELASEMRTIFEKKRFIELLDNFLAEKKAGNSDQAEEEYGVKEAKSWDDVDTDAKKDDSLPSFESGSSGSSDSSQINYERPKARQMQHLHDEKSLSEEDLRSLVMDSRKEIHDDIGTASAEKKRRFIVKEFIYGFIIGLVFGLIMLGIIFQLKPYC